jgi:hypothetical protein
MQRPDFEAQRGKIWPGFCSRNERAWRERRNGPVALRETERGILPHAENREKAVDLPREGNRRNRRRLEGSLSGKEERQRPGERAGEAIEAE